LRAGFAIAIRPAGGDFCLDAPNLVLVLHSKHLKRC
jgi:hypothetical protein